MAHGLLLGKVLGTDGEMPDNLSGSSVHLCPLLSGADSLEMLSLVLGFSDSTHGQHRVETVALCRGLKRLLEEKYCSVPATSGYQSDELHPVYCIVLCIYTQRNISLLHILQDSKRYSTHPTAQVQPQLTSN